MNCIRCNKELGHADSSNSDYVIADEFIIPEKRECFYAITKDKEIPIKRIEESLLVTDLERVEARLEDVNIQKTGLICPDCYKETDTIIWGIHKK